MKKLSLAVGTTSPQKISYIKDILKDMGMAANILPASVSSGVAEQPMTSGETKRGAQKRAQRAFGLHPSADCSLGVEVGYRQTADGYQMLCWAALVTKSTVICQSSPALLLPDYHQRILLQNLPLGENLKPYDKMANHHPTHKYFADGIRYREFFIKTAVTSALWHYFRPMN